MRSRVGQPALVCTIGYRSQQFAEQRRGIEHEVAQHVSDAPGPGAAAAWEVVPATPLDRRRVVASLLAAALAGAVAGPVLTGTVGTPDALKLAAYGAITFGSLAAVVGSLADRGRRAIDRFLLDLRAALGTL